MKQLYQLFLPMLVAQLVWVTIPAHAQPPGQLNFHGEARDLNGAIISGGAIT